MKQSPKFYTPRGSISSVSSRGSLSSSSSSLYETPVELPDEIPLDQLPLEILENIFKYATPEDIYMLSRTNTTLYAALLQARYRTAKIIGKLKTDGFWIGNENNQIMEARLNSVQFNALNYDLHMMCVPIFFVLNLEKFRDMFPILNEYKFKSFMSKIIDTSYEETEEEIYRKHLAMLNPEAEEEKYTRKFQYALAALSSNRLQLLVRTVGCGERLRRCVKLLKEFLAFKENIHRLKIYDDYEKIEGKILQLKRQSADILNLWQVRATSSKFFLNQLIQPITKYRDGDYYDKFVQHPIETGENFYVIAEFGQGQYFFVKNSRNIYGVVNGEAFSKLVNVKLLGF